MKILELLFPRNCENWARIGRLRARQVLFEFLRKILRKILSKILTKILEIELESGACAPSRRALRARQDFNFFPINFENWARIGRLRALSLRATRATGSY